jgi:hypothetical protein
MRLVLMALVTVSTAFGVCAQDAPSLVERVTAPDAAARMEAAHGARATDAEALTALADRYETADVDTQSAILHAIERVASTSGAKEGQKVAEALAAVLAKPYPEPIQRQVLEGLALTATDSQVPTLAALLGDATLGSPALRALAAIPGSVATEALITAIPRTPEALRPSVIHALGQRGDPQAIPALQAMAQGEGPARWVTLDALAMLGVPPHQTLPFPPNATAGEAQAYTLAILHAADARATAGDTATAEGLYLSIATSSNRRHVIVAALHGLADLESEQFVPMALGYLHQPQVGAPVADLLRETKMPGLDDKLAEAWPSLNGPAKAVVLDILTARDAPVAEDIARRAMEDADALVRVRALRLLDMQPDTALLLAALDDSVRQRDLESFRDSLAELLTRAHEAEIQELGPALGDVAAGPFPEAFRVLALDASAELATREALPAARTLLDDPALGGAAGRAFAAITARHAPQEKAVELLSVMVLQSPYDDVRVEALEHLKQLGANAPTVLRSGGWITDWRLSSPQGDESFVVDQWPPTLTAADATAVLVAEAPFPVILHIQADAPYRLTLGEKVLASGSSDRSVKVTLDGGPNELRVQSAAPTEPVTVAVRVSGRDGTPLNVNETAEAVDGQPRLYLETREASPDNDIPLDPPSKGD